MKTLFLTALTLLLSVAGFASDQPIISAQLKRVIGSVSDQPIKIWLYFDSTQIADNPINLSQRALARRAKVDPVNFLVSETDYSLRPELIDSIRRTGVEVKRISRWFKGVAVELPGDRLNDVISLPGLKRLDIARTLIGFREPDQASLDLKKMLVPDSSDYGASYTQNRTARTIKLHQAGYSGKGVLIAMFDSGFNPNHQAFDSTSLLATWDFINDREAVDGPDCAGSDRQDRHGTATWSSVGGYVSDTLIGTAYGADFALAKTEITCGGTEIKVEEYNWIAAAEWADSLGADIITASLGYYIFDDSGSYTQDQLDGNTALITIAADLAASKNILVVNSAGNERETSWGTILFPADGDSVLAVGAIAPDSNLARFSSPGPSADGRVKPDVVTLGMAIIAAQSSDSGWASMSGTSFSAPILAGGAALIMESGPSLTAEEIRQMIIGSADRFDNPDPDYGYGIFDAVRAADIITWVPTDPIMVLTDQLVAIPVTTSGRLTAGATLRGNNLPPGISLIDLSNGEGELVLNETELDDARLTVELIAAVGQFEDTTSIEIITYDGPEPNATAGPNPFTNSVTIYINHALAAQSDKITITVFNLAGKKIREIIKPSSGFAETIVWDGRNSAGRQTAPGMYIILVQTGVTTQQLKLLKTG